MFVFLLSVFSEYVRCPACSKVYPGNWGRCPDCDAKNPER